MAINRKQAIDYIVKEFKLLPFQEYIIRQIWESKRYLIPIRGDGWSSTNALLTMVDLLLKRERGVIVYENNKKKMGNHQRR